MKRKLLLYLSRLNYAGNVPIAATFAWLSRTKDYLFDNYYDSYHQGIHFPGGDSRNLDTGQLTGGTLSGDRHFEEFYFMLLNFDISVASSGGAVFQQSIKHFNVPLVSVSEKINVLYKETFRHLNVDLPQTIVMTGSYFKRELSGLETYLYPEIYYRKAIGVPESISEEELSDLYRKGDRILCVYVHKDKTDELLKRGYEIEVIDEVRKDDTYLSITGRLALRWKECAKGWILGDPVLIAHWLPKACEEGLISIYSIPQGKVVSQLKDLIASTGKVVYGRQYSDKDFFELSRLNQCLQVIDPCRPPFQSVKHVEYAWDASRNQKGFYDNEYSDEELRQFAGEGRILISLMFWSGMIREIENFYNLMDLIAMTTLRSGLVLTAQSLEYMMHSPFELLTVPVEQGGVYPLVEPVLGSCGIGVGIESHMTKDRLQEDLREGLFRIFNKVKKAGYMPRGWWATMDTDLEKLNGWEKLKPVRFFKYPPYVQVRYHAKDKPYNEEPDSTGGGISRSAGQYRGIERLKEFIIRSGLIKYFEPYRPYEFYKAGQFRKDIMEAVKSAGLQYMFTKAGFGPDPRAEYIDDGFIALNYTAGQWDGWTPFETINDVSDLKKAEKILLKKNRPGWIVSTIDSCLWTFGGEFWKRGNRLYDIAQFCSEGGSSKKLINVKPFTVARYARILSEKNNQSSWTDCS